MVITRIAVGSAAVVFGAFNALMGLFVGLIFAAVSLLGAGFAGDADPELPPFMGALFGVGAVVFFPIFYGMMGVVFGALGAAFYNLIAGLFGGLRIETH